MSWLQKNYEVALSNPIILSVLIILGAVIAAKITDMIFTRIFKRIVNKTQTNLDDRILEQLHRPIFYSILFIGFSVAVKTAELPNYIDYALVGIFKTSTILIWLFVCVCLFVCSFALCASVCSIYILDFVSSRISEILLGKDLNQTWNIRMHPKVAHCGGCAILT